MNIPDIISFDENDKFCLEWFNVVAKRKITIYPQDDILLAIDGNNIEEYTLQSKDLILQLFDWLYSK